MLVADPPLHLPHLVLHGADPVGRALNRALAAPSRWRAGMRVGEVGLRLAPIAKLALDTTHNVNLTSMVLIFGHIPLIFFIL